MAAQSIPDNSYILGLDIGNARIGLALAHSFAKLPNPYAVLQNDNALLDKLVEIIDSERVQLIVIGLPRDKDGQETEQSKTSRDFADELSKRIIQPIEFADESLSSIRSEESKNYKSTSPKYLDDVAACYILEEFFGNING